MVGVVIINGSCLLCVSDKQDKLRGFSLCLLVGSKSFWQSTADNVVFDNSIGFVLSF